MHFHELSEDTSPEMPCNRGTWWAVTIALLHAQSNIQSRAGIWYHCILQPFEWINKTCTFEKEHIRIRIPFSIHICTLKDFYSTIVHTLRVKYSGHRLFQYLHLIWDISRHYGYNIHIFTFDTDLILIRTHIHALTHLYLIFRSFAHNIITGRHL